MTSIYKIADTVFSLETSYELTSKLSKDYLSKEEPEVSFKITKEDIESERQIEKDTNPDYNSPDDYLEFIAAERKLTDYLISKNIFLMHGVLLNKDNVGYLFIATSGTGKSTHAYNWYRVFGKRIEIVNGDKPFIKIENGVAYAYGSPWCGKEFMHKNKRIVLNNIVGLSRSETNQIKQVGLQDIYALLFQQSYKSKDKEKLASTLSFLEQLGKSISFYSLCCNMDKESAIVAYKGMSKAYSFEDILDCEGRLTYLTKGVSMMPLLRQDLDLSVLDKIKSKDDIKVNDAVLFKRDNGQYVLHRLVKIEKDGTYSILGDNLYQIEKGIRRDQILAKLVGVDKGNGHYIDAEGEEYKSYVKKLTKHHTSRRLRIFFRTKLSGLKSRLKRLLIKLRKKDKNER